MEASTSTNHQQRRGRGRPRKPHPDFQVLVVRSSERLDLDALARVLARHLLRTAGPLSSTTPDFAGT